MALDTRHEIEEALTESGVDIGVERFVGLLKVALRTVTRGRSTAGDASALTAHELAELKRGGLKPQASLDAYREARAGTAAHTAVLMAAALSTAEAARRLGVDSSRVRQMLGERSLLGFKDSNEWRVLDIQFADAQLVPNIRQVVRALPESLPMVTAANWLTTAEADLERHGEPVSPLQWLAEGGDVELVAALAADL